MKTDYFKIILILILTLVLSASASTLEPPRAKKIPYTETHHGVELKDDYHWLLDTTKSDPEVIAYVKAENEYTDQMLKHTEILQEKLYKELIGRLKEDNSNVPYKIDNYYYYSRWESGKQYSIHCRRKGSLKAPEEVYLDVNKLAEGHKFYRINMTALSKNHQFVAFGYDTTGTERYILQIMDTKNNKILTDTIEGVGSIIWANDNKTLFYSKTNESRRSTHVFKHILGTDPKEDIEIFAEKDESFYVWVIKSKSRKYILIGTGSDSSNEIRYINADNPGEKFKVFQPREKELYYYFMDHGDKFYIYTDKDKAINGKIMVTDKDKTGKEHWKEFIPHRPKTPLSCDVFKDYLVIYEKVEGVEKIKILNFKSGKTRYIKFNEPIYSINFGSNSDYNTRYFRYSYSSLTTPWTIYEYDMKTGKQKMLKRYDVVGDYNPDDYKTERVLATAPDGTKVPISLVYKKSLFKKDGSNPLYLRSYGSFGYSQNPTFSSARLTLLDRGFVIALAHIRGGGDLGAEWHEEAKGLNKKVTFTDFIACAETLIKKKYTTSKNLVIEGGSAGGLLMGAVVNMRPDLFGIVIASIPVLDYLNAMLYPTVYGIINYYEEWGDPKEKKYFDYQLSYCPYKNIERKNYPHILVTAGLNDARVKFWSPLKWVAKMRDYKTDDNLLLIKIEMGTGHKGSSGRYDVYKNVAFEYAFILDTLGIKE